MARNSSSEAVAVEDSPAKPAAPPTRYWLGIAGELDRPMAEDDRGNLVDLPLDDPRIANRLPFDRLTCGGMDFCRWTEDVGRGADGDTIRSRRIGRVVPLSQRQVEAIRAAANHKVVRRVGQIAQLLDARDARYVHDPSDTPVGRWLYLIPVPPGGIPRDEVPQANLG